jgi:hypothetical protein
MRPDVNLSRRLTPALEGKQEKREGRVGKGKDVLYAVIPKSDFNISRTVCLKYLPVACTGFEARTGVSETAPNRREERGTHDGSRFRDDDELFLIVSMQQQDRRSRHGRFMSMDCISVSYSGAAL